MMAKYIILAVLCVSILGAELFAFSNASDIITPISKYKLRFIVRLTPGYFWFDIYW